MELTQLKYFRTIIETGRMTKAASLLGVTQPALSAMLKKLEKEVGAELVHRTGRGIEPTEAGLVFAKYGDEALRAASAGVKAVRELMGLERGTIRVGGGATATGYILPPVIGAFRQKSPGLRFFIREAGSRAVADAVLSGELDLGIVTLPILGTSVGSLVRVPLVADEMRLICPPRHRLLEGASSKGFRWKDVEGEPFVAFEGGTAVRELIDAAAQRAGVTLNVVMELRSIESIKQMVYAGIGVALVSRFALEEGEGLSCREARLSRRLAIVKLRDRSMSPAAAAFERALLDRVRPREGSQG